MADRETEPPEEARQKIIDAASAAIRDAYAARRGEVSFWGTAEAAVDAILPAVERVLRDRIADPENVEKIAAELGAKHRPSYQTWRRRPGRPPQGSLMMDHGDWVMTEPGNADDATMVVFKDADGENSLRSLTWREVVGEVLAVVRGGVSGDREGDGGDA